MNIWHYLCSSFLENLKLVEVLVSHTSKLIWLLSIQDIKDLPFIISTDETSSPLNEFNRLRQSVEAIFSGVNLAATDDSQFWGEIQVCSKTSQYSFWTKVIAQNYAMWMNSWPRLTSPSEEEKYMVTPVGLEFRVGAKFTDLSFKTPLVQVPSMLTDLKSYTPKFVTFTRLI